MQELMKSICFLLACVFIVLIFSVYTFSPLLEMEQSPKNISVRDRILTFNESLLLALKKESTLPYDVQRALNYTRKSIQNEQTR